MSISYKTRALLCLNILVLGGLFVSSCSNPIRDQSNYTTTAIPASTDIPIPTPFQQATGSISSSANQAQTTPQSEELIDGEHEPGNSSTPVPTAGTTITSQEDSETQQASPVPDDDPTSLSFIPKDLERIEPDNSSELRPIAQLWVPHVFWVHFSPDSGKLATVYQRPAERDWYVKVWDLEIGIELYEVAGGPTIVFSTDSSKLATSIPGTGFYVWSVDDGSLLETIELPASVAISPDWRFVVEDLGYITSTESSTIILSNLESGLVQGSFQVEGTVVDVRFSPDGRMLAVTTGGIHSQTILWDVETSLILDILVETDRLFFAPDGRWLGGLFGPDRSIRLIDTGDFKHYREFQNSQGPQPLWVAVSPENQLLGAALGNSLMLWNISSGNELVTLEQQASYLSFSPDGRLMVTSNYAGDITLWGIVPDQ